MEMLARAAICLAIALGAAMALPKGLALAAAQSAPSVVGWVEIAPVPEQANQLRVVGHAYATAASVGRYTLVISRTGKGDNTSTQQGGKFSISPGESKRLSSTAINLSAGGVLKIELRLYIGEKEVFSVLMQSTLPKDSRDI